MCEECGWEELVEDIDKLLEDENYEFAIDTLKGIRDWVVDNEHCTVGQKKAVENISYSNRD